MSSLTLIRPKSIATVVGDFRSTPAMSSTPMLALVRTSSVCSGRISLTAPTSVVLPTPNPPATRIFTASGIRSPLRSVRAPAPLVAARSAPFAGARSERAEPIDYRLENAFVGPLRAGPWLVHQDESLLQQVAEQHADHAEREVQVRRELGHRHRFRGADEDRPVLRLEVHRVDVVALSGHDERQQVEPADGRAAAPAGDRVGPNDRPGLGVEPGVAGVAYRRRRRQLIRC